MCAFADHAFMGYCHDDQNDQQVNPQQRNADMVGNQTEKGRHQGCTHIGACHLDTNQGLRLIRAEMLRGGMDHTGVDRSAAKPNQQKTNHRAELPQWK